MTPAERRRRLAELGSMPKVSDDTDGDPEIGYDDVDERTEDELATAVSGAQEIEALRAEVAELRQLVSHADRVRQMGTERKLAALQACLKKSELPRAGRRPRQAADLHRAPRHPRLPRAPPS